MSKSLSVTLSALSGAWLFAAPENLSVSLDSLRRVKEGDLFTAILKGEEGHECRVFRCEARTNVVGRNGSTTVLARPIDRANAAVREFTFTVSLLPSEVLWLRRTSDGVNRREDKPEATAPTSGQRTVPQRKSTTKEVAAVVDASESIAELIPNDAILQAPEAPEAALTINDEARALIDNSQSTSLLG